MFPGSALVLTVSVIAGCWTVTSVVKHVFGGSSAKESSSPEDSELTASELEALVRRATEEAVDEASAPLRDKIERLERRLDGPSDDAERLKERDYGLIDEWPDEELAEADATRTRVEQRAT